MTEHCRELNDRVVELVEGDLDRAEADALRAHAAACDDCGCLLAVEESLVAALREAVVVPDVVVPMPEPDVRRLTPVRALRIAAAAAAAAAALLVGVVSWSVGLHAPVGNHTIVEQAHDGGRVVLRPVEIHTVLESSEDAPLPDDGLLALTAGVEAVVMRRPAQGR